MFNTILVPVDGSAPSHKATKVACDIAKKYSAKLFLAHTLFNGASLSKITDTANNEGFLADIEDDLARDSIIPYASTGMTVPAEMASHDTEKKVGSLLLSRAQKEAAENGVADTEVFALEGQPAEAIIKFARESNVDLIVTGSRGFGDLKSILLGSFSHQLLKDAPCPCLIVK